MELTKSMFRALSLESSKNEETMRQQEYFHNEFMITVPKHHTTHLDRRDDIPAFFTNKI